MTKITDDPSFEDAVKYLRTTVYNRTLIKELTLRRETALGELSSAETERDVFKVVGRIDAFEELISSLRDE
tara:strand:- start:1192 stop:1404 length:213 start_codon:yes stop_codon:yes gene_type:complete